MTTGDCGVQGHNSNLPHSNQLISAGGVSGEANQYKQMEKNESPTVMWQKCKSGKYKPSWINRAYLSNFNKQCKVAS